MKGTEEMKETDLNGKPSQAGRTVRVSYPDSGFSFTMTRCKDAMELRDQVVRRCRYAKGAWLKSKNAEGAPEGFCYTEESATLPGVVKEAAPNGSLVEIAIFVTGGENERTVWYHEIGHAAEHAAEALPKLAKSEGYTVNRAQCREFLACVNELLCEQANVITGLVPAGEASGSGLLYTIPWSPDYDTEFSKGVRK